MVRKMKQQPPRNPKLVLDASAIRHLSLRELRAVAGGDYYVKKHIGN